MKRSGDLGRFFTMVLCIVLPRTRTPAAQGQNDLPETALTTAGVAVEKLILVELAINSSRQDALQTIFSDRVDISITGF
jgi:hypothetical protein